MKHSPAKMGYFVFCVTLVAVLCQTRLADAQLCTAAADVPGTACIAIGGVPGICGFSANNPGNGVLTCYPIGTAAIACLTLPTVANGHYVTAGPNTATLVCCTGYRVPTPVTITCNPLTGVWTAPAQQCAPISCPAGQLVDPNGAWVPATGGAFASVANLVCNAGFEPTGGPCTAVCLITGMYSAPRATCTRINCKGVPCVANGAWTAAGGSLYQATATITCAAGFAPSIAGATISCLQTGLWSASAVTCVPIGGGGIGTGTVSPCGALPATTNGHYALISATTANLVCCAGYNPTAAETLMCNTLTGMWSIPIRHCTPVVCAPTFPAVANGMWHAHGNSTFGQLCALECNPGFYARPSPAARVCQANGQWSTSTATCCAVTTRRVMTSSTGGGGHHHHTNNMGGRRWKK